MPFTRIKTGERTEEAGYSLSICGRSRKKPSTKRLLISSSFNEENPGKIATFPVECEDAFR